MGKEKIIDMAKELHERAFDANVYYMLMMQYKENKKEYGVEMNVSPAFYQIVYEALQKACFMEVAKIYDTSKESLTIGSLLSECQENITVFPEERSVKIVEDDGTEYSISLPYRHKLKKEEECFYADMVKSQREIFKFFDLKDVDTMPVSVDVGFAELLKLYQKRFHSLSKESENVRVQRNKVYAHNDPTGKKQIKKYPLTYSGIRELIDFAFDCTELLFGLLTSEDLTSEILPRTYSNIDDWENTLEYTRLGLKYFEQRDEEYFMRK